MHILALQPYFGGSHLAAMNGWIEHSGFEFTVLELPPRHWKWRMRQSAWTLAEEASKRWNSGSRWDAVFCTDMLNFAEFKGLVCPEIASLPSIAYFHENQFVYPTCQSDQRDSHFEITNFTTALAADEVWFNSSFNRDSMLTVLTERCKNWPDYPPTKQIEQVRTKSRIQTLGIAQPLARRAQLHGQVNADGSSLKPLHIVWAARWEHDKGPESLLEILRSLRADRFDFRISVIGQSFRKIPQAFSDIKTEFGDLIERWGFQETADDYWSALAEADLFLSTAEHEFFGLSAVEAIAAGLYPVFPNRLSYPELLRLFPESNVQPAKHLYSSPQEAAALIQSVRSDFEPVVKESECEKLLWKTRAVAFDQGVKSVLSRLR